MKSVTLIYTVGRAKSHNLSVGINYASELVFNQGDYYRPVNDGDYQEGGREYDEYLIVAPEQKALVLQRLREDLPPDSHLPQAADVDGQFLEMIEQIAPIKKWQSFVEIEEWLTEKQIPFRRSHWLQID
jgi:hypothetical protein